MVDKGAVQGAYICQGHCLECMLVMSRKYKSNYTAFVGGVWAVLTLLTGENTSLACFRDMTAESNHPLLGPAVSRSSRLVLRPMSTLVVLLFNRMRRS